LQQLAREFQEEEDDDDDDEVSPKPFKATTESLSNLLQQCLQSGDDTMLELSLTCRDRQIIQRSLQQLEPNLVSTLLTKLTSRLASKPNRAGDLALWIQLILTSGKIRNVQQLRPLRNLLHERVESFPHLLKLEGRLSVLQASSSLK
jgi:U3 small nucleolar RNA-associated protein 5